MAYSPIFGTPTVQPGFLGLDPSQRRVRGIGDTLTQLGIGLMGQGPSLTPQGGPLQGLAAGLQGANQMANQRLQQDSQAQQNTIQAGEYGMEKQKFDTAQQMTQMRQAALEKAVIGLPPDQQAAARADPEAFWKAYSEYTFMKPKFRAGDTRDIQQGAQSVTQEYQPDGSWKELGRGPKFAGPNQSIVNMPPVEGAFAKAFGGAEGDAAGKLANEVGPTSQQQIQNMQALQQAFGDLQSAGGDTGALANLQTRATQISQALGIDPSKLGLPTNAGPAETIKAISNQLALQMRNPGAGTGMPGSMSDADREYLSQTVANLGDTPQGFQAKVGMAQKAAERQLQMATLWNSGKYEQTQAGFRKFKQDWVAYVNANPLFGQADRKKYNSSVVIGQPSQPTTATHDQLNPADGWQ